MDLQTARAGLALIERGEDFAWVSVLDTRGSLPRHSGATMLVTADGSLTGSIGGGPLEAAAIEQALEVIGSGRPRLMVFDTSSLGMMCGGEGSVLIDYVDSSNAAAQGLLRELSALLGEGRRGWLVTSVPADLSAGSAVRRRVVVSDESGAADPALSADEGSSPTYVQPIGARGTAYVFGAGHCGQSLVPVLSALSFYTVVIDDRPEFADRRRFPEAGRVVVADSFDRVVETLSVDEDSYIVIVTR